MVDNTGATDARNFFKPRMYDRLKFIAQIILPAVSTLYFSLTEIWNLPYGLQVVGTITAIDLFLGVILGFSSQQYYKTGSNFDGQLSMVSGEDGNEKVVFDVESDPETVIKQMGKHSFEFRVNRNS